MGLTKAKIELRNPRLPDLPPVIVDALADTGSDHVCIPEHIRGSWPLTRPTRSG